MGHASNDSELKYLRLGVLVLAAGLVAACGGDGDDGNQMPTPDTTAPTVSVTPPPANVSRTATISVTANDNVGVTQVELFVDDASVGADTTAPFAVDWDTSTADEGEHVLHAVASDAAGNTATSADVTVTVSNIRDFPVTLTPTQAFPVPDSGASGEGSFTVNLVTGEVTGSVTVSGMTPTAAHLHDGFAGVNGPVVQGLEQDAMDAAVWQAPADASLTDALVDRLLAGALYVNVHSDAFPGGEIRAQLLPEGFRLFFTDLAGLQEVPEVFTTAGARGAVTVDTNTGAAAIHVNTTDSSGAAAALPGVTAAHLHTQVAGVNGPVRIGLDQDPDLASHWFNDEGVLDAAGLEALLSARTYLNVHSDDHPGGEIRGQVVPDGYTVVVSRMTGEQEVPPNITAGRGTAALTVEHATGAADIRLNVTGADDANAAHIHSEYAGANGGVIIGLEKDAGDPTKWRSNGAVMTGPQMDLLADGGLYANVHTPAEPAGLARGQLLPDGVQLVISHMTGAQEAPDPVDTAATGRASTTVNLNAGTLTIHVRTEGVDDATDAHIHTGARDEPGPVSIGLTQDGGDVAHWFAQGVMLTAQQVADYQAGNLYVNVHTPANTAGEIRGQIELGGVAPLLYSDIQAEIFNTNCATSGCHSGGAPAAGLSLDPDVSHDNLVGVASTQVAELFLVEAGDAPASYLIRKLAGGPDIVNQQMPIGLPPLDPATIDRMAAWANAGALPAPEPPAVDDVAPMVTLGNVPGTITGTVTLTAEASDNVGVTLVRWRVDGTVVGSDTTAPYSFDWDSTTVADGAVTLDAQAMDAAGNIGTSASTAATVSNPVGVEPFTFTEIQTQIFNNSCAQSGCHSGGSPQAGMDLSAPAYDDIVNVPSSQQPSLLRIDPGNSDDSYLIRKLEGGPGITGQRMPFGGPFLDQATIDRMRAWVDEGAPNN